MPVSGQGQSWSDVLCCVTCSQVFSIHRHPVNLTCGHVVCRPCAQNITRNICPIDEIEGVLQPSKYPPNTALLHIVTNGRWRDTIADWHAMDQSKKMTLRVIDNSLRKLAAYLIRADCERGGTVYSEVLSRTMQRKLVALLCFQLMEEEGRSRALKTSRAMADRVMTEVLLSQQVASHLSTQLWTAVRSRGCQFLGPAMQEDVLRLILLALGTGAPIARKTLVMYVVQMLSDDYPQVSKTCVGHVVQLLYRASCFHVLKRDGESSLMQLKEEFRGYENLRKEHDMQIVQMALEAGLRICPDQWSALLYGDQQHRSHMQSIIDKLQSLQSFQQGMDELGAIATKGDELVGEMLPLLGMFSTVHPTHHERVSWERFSEFMSNLSTLVDLLVQHAARRQERRAREQKDAFWRGRNPTGGSDGANNGGRQNTATSPQKYKTKMCRDVMLGHTCPRGTHCTWAHSHDEIQESRGGRKGQNNGFVGGVTQQFVPMGNPPHQRSAPIPVGMAYPSQQAFNAAARRVPQMNGIPHPEPVPLVPVAVHQHHQQMPMQMQPMLLMSSQATSPVLMTGPRPQSAIWQSQMMVPQTAAMPPPTPLFIAPSLPPMPRLYQMDSFSPPNAWGRTDCQSKADSDPDQLLLKRKEILSRLAPFNLGDEDDCENDGGIGHVSYTVASSVLDERELQFPFRGPPPLELPPIPVSYAPVLPTVPTEENMLYMGDIAAIQARPRAPSLPMIQVTTVLTACPGGLLTSESSKPATVQSDCSEMHVRDSMSQPLATAILQGTGLVLLQEAPVVPVVSIEATNAPVMAAVAVPPQAVVVPLPSMDPQDVVSNTIDRIVDVKERLSEAGSAPIPCAVSQQLREELRIAEREMDSLDPRTQASCLLRELEQVDREIERMELSRPVDC